MMQEDLTIFFVADNIKLLEKAKSCADKLQKAAKKKAR
jgi:hypothetical protein